MYQEWDYDKSETRPKVHKELDRNKAGLYLFQEIYTIVLCDCQYFEVQQITQRYFGLNFKPGFQHAQHRGSKTKQFEVASEESVLPDVRQDKGWVGGRGNTLKNCSSLLVREATMKYSVPASVWNWEFVAARFVIFN